MYENKLIVPAPKIKDRQFSKPLLCGPGPSDIWPSVNEALTKPILSPFCDELFNVMDDIRAGLQYAFQTKSKLVLAMSGSGHSGMEAVISNLVGPKQKLLICARGIWDDRALDMATRYGINAIVHRIPFNTTFSFAVIEGLLKRIRPKALFITHGDSSTGSVQKIEGLGTLCHKYGALLLVDTVVSLSAEPFLMDEWGVDGVYSSTQKVLSGPAGISPVAFSERAQEVIKKRNFKPPFYFDIELLAAQWNCFGNTRKYHHTLSPPLLWALRTCLKELIKETLPEAWARHSRTTAHFQKRIQELSLELLIPKPEDRLVTVTTVVLPKGYDYIEFVKYMIKNHNILIFPGLGPTVGKALRVGIMGVNSTIQVADAVADAIADTLIALKKSSL
ncbi:alanine--glyoxylate aminotransferase-like [Achroia grisella]|uniref:alanine--glyoxylate aminotransferase-like n=1 Tax=Achroia grisella TaxID=688607 RepID=UPI0027D1FF62|nr:alanine--glyoxylate aminotransferase-like [Achroia grisella]XP_059052831.1 alanine--glyoxylate aminotransferase-like [Achroia grisella]XP_059052832.1 alanine--glyoxylate aminotransferase-like [Achroia grisella]